jgi:hypothetical protein
MAVESKRPAALSVRAAAVSAVRSVLLQAPIAAAHNSAMEIVVSR